MKRRGLPLMAALLATLAITWGLAAGAGTTVGWHRADASALRLSWSARPERIESCRERTAEELAARPAHMRQALDCVGRSASYLLEVRVDGALLDSVVVHGSGARQDRPIFLLRDYPMLPGERRLHVSFTRREPADTVQSKRENRVGIAPHLSIDTLLAFRPGVTALVTYDAGALILREP
ncbi:MAG: hypothetical protein ACYC0B_03465 [Gemmatimonadaceae bacterium]